MAAFALTAPAYAQEADTAPTGTVEAPGDQVVAASDTEGTDAAADAAPVAETDQQGADTATEPQATDGDIKEEITFDDEEMKYAENTTVPSDENDLMTELDEVVVPENPEMVDGFQYLYLGADQQSKYFAAFGYTDPEKGATNEVPFEIKEGLVIYVGANRKTFVSRGLLVDNAYLIDDPETLTIINAQTGDEFLARWSSVEHFTMIDENGNTLTVYCADQATSAVPGFGYNVKNLHEATYYTEAEASMIRAIASKGYWGTESGTGSLASVKQMMTESGKFTQAEVDSLTDGMAMTATQFAIWTFSNVMDKVAFYNTYYCDTNDFYGNFKQADHADAEVIFKLYHHLANLDPVTIEERTTANTIINKDHFLDDAALTAMAKPVLHPNNQDADDTNDFYIVDFTFKMNAQPDQENDNLVITLKDALDNIIAKGRVAGELQEGEIQVTQDKNGWFRLAGLLMQEGDITVRASLSGKQYLAEDAYLFTSEVREGESSQTMVGIAEGPYRVDVETNLSFYMEPDDELIPITGDEDPNEGDEPSGDDPSDPGTNGEEPSDNEGTDEGEEAPSSTGTITANYAENTPAVETSVLPSTNDEAPARALLALSLLGFGAAAASAFASRKAFKRQK